MLLWFATTSCAAAFPHALEPGLAVLGLCTFCVSPSPPHALLGTLCFNLVYILIPVALIDPRSTLDLKKGDTLTLSLAPGGGQAIRLKAL